MAATDRTCRWVCRRLPLLAGGELAGPERRKVERHLIGCPACAARGDAAGRSLSILQEVGSIRPAIVPGPADLPLWPALARQIREAKHQSARVEARPWGSRFALGTVGGGLAASLALALGWGWSAREVGPVALADRPVTSTNPVPEVQTRVTPPLPGREPARSDDSFWFDLNHLEIPIARLEPRASALPGVNPAGGSVATRPGVDPFNPPLPLRLDYDLDRGTSAGPVTRDTQRAY